MYEELMSVEETRRAVELPRYFSVMPAFRGVYRKIGYSYPGMISDRVSNPYVSANETPMDKESLRDFLNKNQLLDEDLADDEHPDRRYWPGERGEETAS